MSLEEAQLEQGDFAPNAELSDDSSMLSDEQVLEALLAQEARIEAVPVEEPAEPQPPEVDPAELEEDPEHEPVAAGNLESGEADPVAQEPEATETPAVVPTEPTEPKPTEAPVVNAGDEFDYKGFYERVTGTFKANGREVTVKDSNDIIALMQQGANYDKKMAGLKPALQVHRTLDKAGLLDPEKIGFMIDLYQGKPEALARLAAEREIDLFNLDTAKGEGYVPQHQMASDQEVAMTSVLTDLQDNPTFKETFSALQSWDAQSQDVILNNPEMLYMFQEHKDGGMFDTIMQTIQSERMFGRLRGVSTFDAYRTVGDRLYGQPTEPQQANQLPNAQSPAVMQQPVVVPTAPTAPTVIKEDPAVKQKRAAAAAPRKVATQAHVEQFNPLTMSDEEVLAMAARNQRLM